ncbi:hypothetical protein L6X91_001879 [Enterococcus faecium]|uniref:hypothetical protein n=1 Tax=Enterococcus faecium TaxID=1352 RepID=UPI0015E2E2FB|nr:hypothetical protein [Enterococcus faecium]EME8205725.1 hypothetical protein [Enterococcus faecium]
MKEGEKLKKWILSATLIVLLRAFADARVIEQSGFTGRCVAFPMLWSWSLSSGHKYV